LISSRISPENSGWMIPILPHVENIQRHPCSGESATSPANPPRIWPMWMLVWCPPLFVEMLRVALQALTPEPI
jgi:hypothetical protein